MACEGWLYGCAVCYTRVVVFSKQMEGSSKVSGINASWAYPILAPADIEAQFLELASQWRRETGMMSLVQKMSMHPAYQRIIGMGQPVVPLILRELEQEPDH